MMKWVFTYIKQIEERLFYVFYVGTAFLGGDFSVSTQVWKMSFTAAILLDLPILAHLKYFLKIKNSAYITLFALFLIFSMVFIIRWAIYFLHGKDIPRYYRRYLKEKNRKKIICAIFIVLLWGLSFRLAYFTPSPSPTPRVFKQTNVVEDDCEDKVKYAEPSDTIPHLRLPEPM